MICQTMVYYSGSPLYHFTLARELKKQGHTVSIYSMWADNGLKDTLVKEGIYTLYDKPSGHYDLILISQPDHRDVLTQLTTNKLINIVHSEYDCETPITDRRIDHYIAIRPQIKDHLIEEHRIPAEQISVIYNGVDFERFNPKKREVNKEEFVKIVLPCTLDALRLKFIEHYTRKANKHYRVFIYGKQYDHQIYTNEWTYVHDEVPDIENYIKDADVVAGILLGRVNLEARAMNIVSLIHDPENPWHFQVYFPEREEFDKHHDITNVAKQIIKLA